MGLTVPSSNNMYVSTRFEPIILMMQTDGTYHLSGSYKLFNSSNDIYTTGRGNYVIMDITKDDLKQPIHTVVYNYIKTKYYPDGIDS